MDLTGTTTSCPNESRNNSNKKNDSTLLGAPKLEPHHWLQFNIPRTPPYIGELIPCTGFSQYILNTVNKMNVFLVNA